MNIESLFIYLGTFFISIFCTWIVEKTSKGKDLNTITKTSSFVFSIIAIMVPCITAALRDQSVGYDVRNYLIKNYYHAKSCLSFTEFYNTRPFNVELLFALLTYVFSKLNNLKLLFFSIELLIVSPVYLTLYKRKKEGSMTIGMIIFLFFFYNFSLSGMRQSIAMSFLLLAYQYYKENRKISSIVIAIFASMFHTSVFIMVFVFCGSICISKLPVKKQKCIYLFAIIASILLFIFYGQVAILIANFLHMISPRYSFYIKNYLAIYSGKTLANIPLTDLVCKSIVVFVFWIAHKTGAKKDRMFMNMFIMVLLGRYFVLFNANFYEALRLAYYFDYLLIIFIPTINVVVKNKLNRIIYNGIFIISGFLYWMHFIMIIGGYYTNNYILG